MYIAKDVWNRNFTLEEAANGINEDKCEGSDDNESSSHDRNHAGETRPQTTDPAARKVVFMTVFGREVRTLNLP